MLTSRLLLASAALLATASAEPGHPVLRFVFDPDYSGVSGYIAFKYFAEGMGGANVEANLNFKALNQQEISSFDKSCTGPIKEFTWHIHTKWQEPSHGVSSSTKLGECAKSITGNHYDPYKICGPASEYADTPACAPKIKEYKCTPEEYANNFAACESGDLSGKFGKLVPNNEGAFEGQWTDPRFPFPSEWTEEWNIVIHAVCGTATPRIACSQGHPDSHAKKMAKKDADDETVFMVGKQLRVRVHTHHDN